MENIDKTKLTGKFRHDDLNNNHNAARSNPPNKSTLSKPDIYWLQKEENRTKIEGRGNLWISNKPLWVSELSKSNGNTKPTSNRGNGQSVHKEKKYVVVGMRGDQIHHFHGAYRNNTIAASSNFRRGSGGDRPKPSKPREE